jgi:hypothetical protein
LAELKAAGNQLVIADNFALPFANNSVGTIITNSVLIDFNTFLGSGVQSTEIWRILSRSGSWFRDGVEMIRP